MVVFGASFCFLSLSLFPSCYIYIVWYRYRGIPNMFSVLISKRTENMKYRMIYREILIRYRVVVFNPPVFFAYMRVFLVSHALSYICISGNRAKYLASRVFVTVGQYCSEDRVLLWVLSLVFAWITPQFCIRHDCCTYISMYAGTANVS